MATRIDDDFMSAEHDGRVIATAEDLAALLDRINAREQATQQPAELPEAA